MAAVTRVVAVLVVTLVVTLAAVAGCARDPAPAAARLVASAERYVTEGHLDKAVIQYRSALQYQPRAAAIHLALAGLYDRLEQPDRALASFARAADLAPGNLDAQVKTAEALIGIGRFQDAAVFARRAVAADPSSASAHGALAGALAGAGDASGARRQFDRARALDARSSVARRMYGTALLIGGRAADAMPHLQEAAALDPERATGWALLGQARWETGDLNGAGVAFEQAVRLQPQSRRLRRALAAFDQRAGRMQDAETQLRRLAEGAADDRLALADFYLGAGRPADAERELGAVQGNRALRNAARLKTALAAQAQGRTAEADRALDAVLKDRSMADQAGLVKARLLLERGEFAGAMAALDAIRARRSEWGEATYVRALVELARGNLDVARRELSRAREQGVDRRTIELGRARVALAGGRTEEAATQARSASTGMPSLDATVVLVRALTAAGRLPDARAVVSQMRERWPDAGVLDVEEGRIALAARRPDQARTAFERADRRAPSTEARLGIVAAYMGERDLARARASLDQWIHGDTPAPELLVAAAVLDAASGDLPAAARTLADARRRAPGNALIIQASSNLAIAQRDLPQAAAYLEQLLAVRGPSPRALVTLGMVRQEAGDASGSALVYEQALAADANAAVAANNLAWVYAGQGRVGEALPLAERAHRLLPKMPQTLHTLGWMYHLAGQHARAVDFLRRARDADTRNPRYHRDLASVYTALDRPAEAARETADAARAGDRQE